MGGQYAELDRRIVKAIARGFNVFDSLHREVRVAEEAARLGELTGSADWRIVDRRIQALRKSGAIQFFGRRWYVNEAQVTPSKGE